MTRDVCLRNKAKSKYNTVITTKVKRRVTFGKKELPLGYMEGLLQQLAHLFLFNLSGGYKTVGLIIIH